MTLAEKLQEVADAHSKGLLSDAEAASQRGAILAEQQKQSSPLIALDRATLRRFTKRPRCCTPLRCSKAIHWIVGLASIALLAVSVMLSCVYYTDVWVTCNGPEATLLNQSHPFFCTDDWNEHEDDDDYYGSSHHDTGRPRWGCGNERFQFTWDNIKYTNYNTTTELRWLDLLDWNDKQAFPLSIGSVTGSDSLWTQSHHAIKSLQVLGHIVSPFGLMTFIFMICVVRRTFFRKERMETPKRWMGFLALFTIILGLVIACTAVNSHMKITNTHNHHDDDDHDHHHGRHHQRYAPAWVSHYPAQYGCQASPFPASLALSIIGIWIAGTMMAVAFIRMACLRCRNFEIDEEQHRFLTLRGYGQLNSLSIANPTISYGATPVPPAYVQTAKEQEMTASFA
jgi:hypothetical protein